jgi:hypothetical protein
MEPHVYSCYWFCWSPLDVITVKMFAQSTANHQKVHGEEMGNPANTFITVVIEKKTHSWWADCAQDSPQ